MPFLPNRKPVKTSTPHKPRPAVFDLDPKHHRGQNFLIDGNILRKIVAAGDILPEDHVVEVGAGNGGLTIELAKHAGQVTAVEIDKDLIPVLEKATAELENVTIVKDDIMAVPNTTLSPDGKPYKVIANIPYSLTSLIIRKFLSQTPRPSLMVLLIQKEVAQRIVAKAGDLNILALSVQYYATPSLLFTVSRNCFWPKPNVDSAVIKIVLNPSEQLPSPAEEEWFFKVVHAGFAAKRKLLASNLAQGLDISKEKVLTAFTELGLNEKIRAEDASVQQWIELARKIA